MGLVIIGPVRHYVPEHCRMRQAYRYMKAQYAHAYNTKKYKGVLIKATKPVTYPLGIRIPFYVGDRDCLLYASLGILFFQLKIDQSNFALPSNDYYVRGRGDPMIEAYVTYALSVAIALGADPAVAKKDVDDLIDFEIELSNVSDSTHYPKSS